MIENISLERKKYDFDNSVRGKMSILIKIQYHQNRCERSLEVKKNIETSLTLIKQIIGVEFPCHNTEGRDLNLQ